MTHVADNVRLWQSASNGVLSMKWTGRVVAHVKDKKMFTKSLAENLKGRDHLKDVGVGGMIKLNRILEKQSWGNGLNSTGSG
jgi:hypothetical protein